MKTINKIGLLLFLLVGYFFVINVMADVVSDKYVPPQTQTTIQGGSIVEINMGNVLYAQVIRAKQWYGRVYEQAGDSYLHLFELIYIPKQIQKYNFMWIHLIFLIVLTLLAVSLFTKNNNKEVKEHEELAKGVDNIGNLVPGNYH